jgi:hypothetical protein
MLLSEQMPREKRRIWQLRTRIDRCALDLLGGFLEAKAAEILFFVPLGSLAESQPVRAI